MPQEQRRRNRAFRDAAPMASQVGLDLESLGHNFAAVGTGEALAADLIRTVASGAVNGVCHIDPETAGGALQLIVAQFFHVLYILLLHRDFLLITLCRFSLRMALHAHTDDQGYETVGPVSS